MKKFIIVSLAAAMLLTAVTACGSKDKVEYDDDTRVLYSDGDASQEETDEEEADDTESEKAEKKVSTTDSDKDKKESSKKEESSKKSSSSKSASSKSTTSKSSTSKSSNNSSKTTSSKATRTIIVPSNNSSSSRSTASNSTSSKSTVSFIVDDDSETDSEKLTDTELDTEKDSDLLSDTDNEYYTDSEDSDTDNEDTDSEGSNEGSDPFNEYDDLIFTYGGSTITLGEDMDSVFDEIGEPNYETEGQPCTTGGTIKIYTYDEIEIQGYPEVDGTYTVCSIQLKSSYVETEKGISIGSSFDDMVGIYGDGYTTLGASTYRYYSASGSRYLEFYVEDDYVADITIAIAQ